MSRCDVLKNENRGARVGQTAWERRHPCLLASVSRSLPGTPQARMGGAPRQFA